MKKNKKIKKNKKYKVFTNLVIVLRKIIKLSGKYKKFFLYAFLFILVVELLEIAGHYMFRDVIDFFFEIDREQGFERLIYLVVIMSLIYFVQSIVNYLNQIVIVKVIVRIYHSISLRVFRKLMALSLGYHEKENTGAKLRKIGNGTESIRTIIDRMLWDVAPTVVRVIASSIFLMFLDYRLGLTFMIIIPVFLYSTFRMNTRAYPRRKKIWKGYERMHGQFGQAIFNVKTVQSYVQEVKEKRAVKRGIVGIIKNQFIYIRLLFSSNFWRNNLIAIGNVLIIIYGAYLVYNYEMTPGTLVIFINISNYCYFSLYSLSRIVDHVMEAKVGVERVNEILDSDAEIEVKEEGIKQELKGEIEFKNVNFDYGEGKVLKNVNFTIKPGEVVALVGPSGGGKTTIAKLLYRYFDVTGGRILIDDENIKDLDLGNYREQLAIVDQDIDIFNSSVKENIAYGRPNSKLVDIKKAAKIANAHEFIENFKKGYNTVVGERGIKLSGGQKQRVGIARAVLVNPKILVFDEATSSLDAESEKLIQDAINKVIKDRTTIVIAHRLSTVKNADKIIVIEKGRVLEVGTHKGLIRKRGIYAKLVKLQMSGFLD
jgi:ABC-type multidrug transport system fused ATPase/permease subunit